MKNHLFSKYARAAIAVIISVAIISATVALFALGNSGDEEEGSLSPSLSLDTEGSSSSSTTTSAITGSDVRAGKNSSSSAKTGIYFPLFDHPGPLWDNMLTYRQAHPALPWIAIVDPLHGPGERYDATYAENIKRLQAADVTVLGYVSTLWAQKSPDIVRDDIRKYKEWYDVDGILLDEMISQPGFEGLYTSYTSYAKSLGMGPVIGNVGTDISPSYIGTVDSISTIEGDRTPPLSWLKGWQLNHDRSNFVYITYSQSWIDPEYVAESANYVGWLYITDDTMPFPYDDFPAYFDQVVAVLDPHGDNSLRNLSVRAFDLRGNSLEGMPAAVAPSATATAATATTPFLRIGSVNSTYTVTALGNSTHVFDHWDDGSTNPSRTVTLDSSKVLRAYYRTPSTSDLHSSVVINALTTQGGQLSMWMGILQANGTDAGSGHTPVIAPAPEGDDGSNSTSYTIIANDHEHLVFDHWGDGSTNRTRTVAVTAARDGEGEGIAQGGNNSSSNNVVYLTAYYRFEKDPSLLDLTVDAYTLDGTEIRGLWSVITPAGQEAPVGGYTPLTYVTRAGATHVVEAPDRDIYVFDHWEDGSTNRTRTITMPGSDTTLSAYYRTPPADMRIRFVSMSGEELSGINAVVTAMAAGASSSHAGSNVTLQQHITESGMTFTGRLGSAYTIRVYDNADYVFDHWDNGSTSETRNVMLSPLSSPGGSSSSSNNGTATTTTTEIVAYYSDRRGGGTASPSSASSLSAASPPPFTPAPQESTEGAAETAPAAFPFATSKFTDGLNVPSAMVFAPDGRLFVAEVGGDVRIVKQDGQLLDAPFLSVSTDTCCESGLLGITLDPDFASNGFVYVYYTVPAEAEVEEGGSIAAGGSGSGGNGDDAAGLMHNRVSRFTADPANPDRALAGSEVPLLDLEPLAPNFHHGGALHFGPDGKLYIGVGDNYVFENAQSLTSRFGKILRINADGSIPEDNPFYSTPGAYREIWAMGLRNPFTMAFLPPSPEGGEGQARMYINDVGHDWAEEINAGEPGANYGWPICEGACLKPEFVDPVYAYTQEDGLRKAITGGVFYTGSQFPEEYRGSYFFADYVQGFIKRLPLPGAPDGGQAAPAAVATVEDFMMSAPSPVDIDVGPDGSLYFLSIGAGEVHKVQYVSPSPVA